MGIFADSRSTPGRTSAAQVPGETALHVLPDGNRVVQVDALVRHAVVKGDFRYPFLGDLIREEWLLFGAHQTGTQAQFSQVEGVQVFVSLYHAVQWWIGGSTTAYFFHQHRAGSRTPSQSGLEEYNRIQGEIRTWLPLIEAGHYPKNPGEHCNLCPVRRECLGL